MFGWSAGSLITADIDVDLFQAALGGEVSCQINPAIAINLRPALLVNLVNLEIRRDETCQPGFCRWPDGHAG